MGKIALAVIGAGSIGAKHAELVNSHTGCRLVGIADSDPSRKSIADRFGVPFCASVEELLRRQRPAGVIIATPNATHANVSLTCAEHGVHMLVEKPIADTVNAARRIVGAGKKHGVRILVGHHRRHNPLVQTTRELIRQGALGKLVTVSVFWLILKPDDYFATSWRREPPGGGPLLINLIHDLDILRFVCGDVVSVYARTSAQARDFDVEDSLSISLRFANGALGTVLASDAVAAPWSYEATTGENSMYFRTTENCCHFTGSAGSLAFPKMEMWRYADARQPGWTQPLERTQVPVGRRDPLTVQLEHFRRVVIGEEPPVIDAEEATRSLALVHAVKTSGATGNAVEPATLLR
ncbi:MAG: Gfo/Idh/MocA family oxidoreductase [Candidatus Pacebacteria bacterium]|nr:Gfo/Idh/MocA family oxidoreductase [Candidatus Paceibacterota bacterium]